MDEDMPAERVSHNITGFHVWFVLEQNIMYLPRREQITPSIRFFFQEMEQHMDSDPKAHNNNVSHQERFLPKKNRKIISKS